jgi:hypothetical protein
LRLGLEKVEYVARNGVSTTRDLYRACRERVLSPAHTLADYKYGIDIHTYHGTVKK